MTDIKQEELKLDDTIKINKQGQPILGRLEGPCADIINPTRNGRKYDEALWEKVFNNPIVKEYFECGGIPGELDHPTDRLETCSEKIAIMMPEPPKKNDKGQLIAHFDILDTPNGRIAYTLAKYGYKLGISSRGNGEVIQDYDGSERVDEDTYDFQGFDLVLLPAVKAARLKMVESLQNGKTFKQAINESLEKATPEAKKIMTETLNNLNIEYTSEKSIDKSPKIVAKDNGTNMVKQLQESLLAQSKLEAQITELQEKLSVCYAKEAKYEEDLAKYKSAICNLSDQAKDAKALKVKLENLNKELTKKDLVIKEEQEKSNRILQKQKVGIDRQSNLTEQLSVKNKEIIDANKQVNHLLEQLRETNLKYDNDKQKLEESLADIKKDLTIKTTEYTNKLTNANKLVEQYKNTAKTAVNKYIESKALTLGLKKEDIINKLSNNYSFNDIDSICESLVDLNLKVSKLPFDLQKVTKASIKESKDTLLSNTSNSGDVIDESLIRLANNI